MEPFDQYNAKGRRPPENLEEELYDDDMEEEEEIIELDKKYNHGQMQLEADEENGDIPLDVDFLFLDPNQSQFFSVKSLLNGLLDGLSYNSSDLANIVCDQVVVGTMIGVEGDEEKPLYQGKPEEKNVLGFVSLLNLQVYENEKVMKEIVQYAVQKSEIHNENHEKFLQVLQTHTNKIGLLINERMINLPPQLVPTLHNQLCEDVKWVKEQNNEDSQAFNLRYILVLSKCYKDSQQPKKRTKTMNTFEDYIFQKFEDFVFLQKALYKFSFSASSTKNVAGLTNLETVKEEQICERLVYLISFDDYVNCVQNLSSYLEG